MFKLIALLALAGAVPLISGCAHHNKLTEFSYVDRPAGYGWEAHKDPNNEATVYYGIDPSNGQTVYVGPDNTYYEFNHPPPIQPGDLHSLWDPHDS
jgi:hypothetical protein